MPDLAMGEILVLCLLGAWCVGVFVFLRFFAARAEKSAAEPEPGRQELDELINRIEQQTDKGWPEPRNPPDA